MTQILFFGSSSVYGVGGEGGGTADYLKQELHKKMYGNGGSGENHAIFNLGISGGTTSDLLARMPVELKHRSQKSRPLVFFSGGSNDTKELSDPDDTSMDGQYSDKLQKVIDIVNGSGGTVIFYGMTPVDESKTTPRINPDGRKVYFFNKTRKRQEFIMADIAKKNDIEFIPIFEEASKLGWDDYLYSDGLHPNTAGHEWITSQIKPVLWVQLGSTS